MVAGVSPLPTHQIRCLWVITKLFFLSLPFWLGYTILTGKDSNLWDKVSLHWKAWLCPHYSKPITFPRNTDLSPTSCLCFPKWLICVLYLHMQIIHIGVFQVRQYLKVYVLQRAFYMYSSDSNHFTFLGQAEIRNPWGCSAATLWGQILASSVIITEKLHEGDNLNYLSTFNLNSTLTFIIKYLNQMWRVWLIQATHLIRYTVERGRMSMLIMWCLP